MYKCATFTARTSKDGPFASLAAVPPALRIHRPPKDEGSADVPSWWEGVLL